MRGPLSSEVGADFVSRTSRTSPSPSASVDLADLRPVRGRGGRTARNTSSEPEAEGENFPPFAAGSNAYACRHVTTCQDRHCITPARTAVALSRRCVGRTCQDRHCITPARTAVARSRRSRLAGRTQDRITACEDSRCMIPSFALGRANTGPYVTGVGVRSERGLDRRFVPGGSAGIPPRCRAGQSLRNAGRSAIDAVALSVGNAGI